MKTAELYSVESSGKVKCTACARYCTLGEGQIGLCGIRQNIGGKLYLLSYGKLFTGHIDPIEKKPVSHYNPGSKIFSVATSGCNWLCHPAGTKILMSDATNKDIEQVQVGDVLWSYDLENEMKILPNVVTHTGSRIAQIWEVRFGSNKENCLLLTEEHPVLTRQGWKQASQLRSSDSILKMWYQNTPQWKESRDNWIKKAEFECKKCGQILSGIVSWNRHRGECYTKGLEVPEEIKARSRRRMKENNPMRDPEVAARALNASKERFLVDPSHGWHRNVSRLRGWLHSHPSSSQELLYDVLDDLGIEYERELRIKVERKLASSKSYYIADAAFHKQKLDIEVDGWWHYHNEEVKKQDKVREQTLRVNGWEVLRVSGSYLYNHPEEVKILIEQRLSPPIMQNKRAWLQVKSVKPTLRYEQVYGIETIPNHNYVADQVIVHNCKYCQNYDISQRRKIEGFDIEPSEVPRLALAQGCQGIAYTYNEPTIFIEFARDIGIEAHKKGLFNVFVSNGFATPDATKIMNEFLDCITVDFKGSGETSFVRKYIGIPGAEPIFQTLLELHRGKKVHIEITDLIVPEVGDSLDAAKKLSNWVYENLGPEMPIHFLRFHPDYKMMDFPSTPIKTLEAHHKIAKEVGLKYVYLGNVPGHPLENTFCPSCGKIVVNRYGFDITGWHLDEKNNCAFCGEHISIEGKLASTVSEDRFLPAYF